MIYHYRNHTLFQALDSRTFLKKFFRFCITGKDFHSLCSKCRIEGGRGGGGSEKQKRGTGEEAKKGNACTPKPAYLHENIHNLDIKC